MHAGDSENMHPAGDSENMHPLVTPRICILVDHFVES